VGRYMSFVASFVPESPENPLPQISTMLQGAVPITSAGFMDGGMVQWEVSVPGSLLARIGQAAMTLQMQNMQKQQKAAPQPIPQVVPQAEFVPQP
ncbi:MAG: hypothetical protein PHP93_08545, partial [Kiritimatiellales bacterium]|nr:hypothetical protein [Kiritimatiellales bacterium]